MVPTESYQQAWSAQEGREFFSANRQTSFATEKLVKNFDPNYAAGEKDSRPFPARFSVETTELLCCSSCETPDSRPGLLYVIASQFLEEQKGAQ